MFGWMPSAARWQSAGGMSSSSTSEAEENQQVESEYGEAYGAGSFSPNMSTTTTTKGNKSPIVTGSPGAGGGSITAAGANSNAVGGSVGNIITITNTTSDIEAIETAQAAAQDEAATAETGMTDLEASGSAELEQAYEAGVSESYNASQGVLGALGTTTGSMSTGTLILLAAGAGIVLWLTVRKK